MSVRGQEGVEKGDPLNSQTKNSLKPGYMGLSQHSLQEKNYRTLSTGNTFRKRLIQIPTHTQIIEARSYVLGLSEWMKFLLRFNPAGYELNVTIILTQILWLSFILTLFFISRGVNARWLALPMWLEIFIQLTTLHLYHSYPAEFSVELRPSTSLSAVRVEETWSILKKLILTLLVTFHSDQQRNNWYILIVVVFGLVLMGSEYFHQYIRPYNTLFNFTNTVTLSLFLINYYGWDALPKQWIFFFVHIWGWALIGGSGLLLLYFLWKLIRIACTCYTELIPIHIGLLTVSFNSFLLGSSHLALISFIEQKPLIFKIEFTTVCLCLFLVQSGNFFYTLWLDWIPYELQERYLTFLLHGTMRSTLIQSTQHAPYLLKILRPLLLQQSLPAGRLNLDPGKLLLEESCILCTQKPSICVIIPCFHSGTCKSCSRNVVSKSVDCPFCKHPMHKILAVIPNGTKDCTVTEEVAIFAE
jgi:VanZ family protein